MKKKILLLFVMLVNLFTVYAQSNPQEVKVYGIDFTGVKVYAANESINDFKCCFEGINMLLVKEPKKYDFSKLLNSEFSLKIETMLKVNQSFDFSDIKTLNKEMPIIDMAKKIKAYDIKETEGKGLVLFAKLFDKPSKKATYTVVLFDISSREIIESKDITEKARGFGLRNFWAYSVYRTIKKCNLNSH